MNAITLRRLAALKLAPEQMAEVLSILAEAQEAEEARKARQRDRKRMSRDKTVTVTGQGRDSHCDIPPKKIPPITPLKNNPPPPQKSKMISFGGARARKPKVPRRTRNRPFARHGDSGHRSPQGHQSQSHATRRQAAGAKPRSPRRPGDERKSDDRARLARLQIRMGRQRWPARLGLHRNGLTVEMGEVTTYEDRAPTRAQRAILSTRLTDCRPA